MPPTKPVPPNYRILLVEDNDLLAEITSEQLEGIGCTVAHIAPTAEAALDWLDDGGAVDLVMSDIVMPGMNGVALAVHLSEHRPDVRVLLTTGYGDDLLDEQCRHYQVLAKPFRSQEMAETIGGLATA